MILLTSSWNSYLSNLLLSQPVSDNNYPLLREFHRCVHDLQKIWHIKLAGLGGCSTTYYEGRPRKLFNLVRIVHIPMYYSFWSLHGQLLFMNLTTRALSFMGKMCLLLLSTSHSRL